jgi:hypothetical protein
MTLKSRRRTDVLPGGCRPDGLEGFEKVTKPIMSFYVSFTCEAWVNGNWMTERSKEETEMPCLRVHICEML